MKGEKYSSERRALHDQILAETINQPPSDFPLAVFIGGGAAAGKSTLRDQVIIPWLGISPVIIDADIMKARLVLNPCHSLASEKTGIEIHKESKYIAQKAIYLCLDNKNSFIYDSSLAAPPDEYLPFIHRAKKAGYHLIIVGVYTSEEVALTRERKRFQKIHRKVPERIFRYFHHQFPVTFMAIEDQFDRMRIYDNSFEGASGSVIAERDGSGLHIINGEKFREFMEKAAQNQ
ncbi:zeta toxin family protein [Candidatus Formimonas warabiya]|uniref:UDP-N-acetylglucosamine kinase n=1 Tax=Formimonas warabiya TaxID=1761012 RepID=A0A3G1KXX7_FORW1|nr:zeta toxin family protein [Candidatus Formimonas warabiya]ATW27338.1 hypothetical protein DCMF_23605 [Candidatus Formimonas warabiya]